MFKQSEIQIIRKCYNSSIFIVYNLNIWIRDWIEIKSTSCRIKTQLTISLFYGKFFMIYKFGLIKTKNSNYFRVKNRAYCKKSKCIKIKQRTICKIQFKLKDYFIHFEFKI